MRLFILASLAGAIAAPAAAADFAGPRIEAHVGWDRVGVDTDQLGIPGSAHDNSIMYGVGIGYDFTLAENVLLGVEADFDFSDAEFSGSDGLIAASVQAKRDIGLGVRLGGKLTETVMTYAKLGYSNARVRARVTDGVSSFSESENGDGVRLGAGIEFALGSMAYAKTEYRYTNYEAGIDRHQVVGGLGVRF